MSNQYTVIREVIGKFMRSLPARDWATLKSTMAPDITREGPEGRETDRCAGADRYIQWLAAMADPLYEYGWDVKRIIYGDDGRTAVVDANTRYLLEKDSEPFGYHVLMIFKLNDQNLIADADLFWKTPKKRLRGDTVCGQ